MIYTHFVAERIISNTENSTVILGKDNTCIKKVDLTKCFSRLENEAKCLEILNGHIAPKLIAYDKSEHALKMEYIKGVSLYEYVQKYGEIPSNYFCEVAKNLMNLLDYGIEYGGDLKIAEHFIIDEDTKQIRIIDFGLSDILPEREDIINFCKRNHKRCYAFVFKDSTPEEVENSKASIYSDLMCAGIQKGVIDNYFKNYDMIE